MPLLQKSQSALLHNGLFGIVIITVFFCSKDYNPFTDPANANVYVTSWSFSDRDSVSLYETGTFKVVVSVPREIDSFILAIPKNRYWPDTVVEPVHPDGAPESGPFLFNVAFYDTGLQTSVVTAHRSNGEKLTREFYTRVYNPLQQEEVRGTFGDTIVLITMAVPDKEVLYHWNFGNGNWKGASISNRLPAIIPLFSPTKGTGTVSVSDLSGNHTSPPVTFGYSLNDTTKPFIRCINDGLSGDSIFTGDSVLAFRAFISDGGNAAVESCFVNGTAFDFVNRTTLVYTKLFKIPPESPVLAIAVEAIDNIQFGNIAHETFYAAYKDDAPRANHVVIDFDRPVTDSTATSQTAFRISGSAQSSSGDTMQLTCTINDTIDPSVLTVIGGGGWSWQVALTSPSTTVAVEAHGTDGRLLASAHRTFIYNPDIVDSIKPVISEIATGNQIVGSVFYTDRISLLLTIAAFDNQSGMAYLVINNDTIPPDTTSQIWGWSTGTLSHTREGNPVHITAVDLSNNVTEQTSVIYRNSPPSLVTGLAIPRECLVESTYTAILVWKDDDNDSVTLEGVRIPKGMTISREGMITWQPAPSAAATRSDTLTIDLSDGYQKKRYEWTFYCKSSSTSAAAIMFITTEEDFDKVLQAGFDRLVIQLSITATGVTFTPKYKAITIDNGSIILNNDQSGLLQWAPSVTDTGLRKLMVTVGDDSRNYDTLLPVVRVVPQNQYPCSLSAVYSGDTTSTGVLDLFTHPEPETLYFSILDRDDPLTESYTVTVSMGGVQSVQTLREKSFFITVEPDSTRLVQTLSVSVRDSTGFTDNVHYIIQYGSTAANTPPKVVGDPGFPVYFCIDSTYEFSMVFFDADGDSVEVIILHAPQDMTVFDDGAVRWVPPVNSRGDDSLVIRLFDHRDTSASYRWPVTVLDCRNLPPAVRFKTTPGDFPPVLQADVDSISLQLTTADETGVRPFTYQVQLDNGMNLLRLNDTIGKLYWIPSSADTGGRTITVSVKDRYNTADTIAPHITIVPRNHQPCSLSYTYSGITLPSGQLSMTETTQPESAYFVISDADHPVTEHYAVTIRRSRSQTPTTLILSGDERTFAVKVNPLYAPSAGSDSIIVSVNDSTGTSDTVILSIRYPISAPKDIGQLSLLLSASTGVTTITTHHFGSSVSRWSYGIGLNTSFSQKIPSRQPTLVYRAVNEQPAISFDHTTSNEDDGLFSSSFQQWTNAPFTVFIVFSANSLQAYERQTLISTNDADAFGLGITCDTSIGIFNNVSQTNCLPAEWSGTNLKITTKTWYVMACQSNLGIAIDGTLHAQAWLNGTAASQIMELATTTGNGLAIGTGSDTFNGSFDGMIASIIIYNRALTDDERVLVELYLGKIYGIPVY